MLGGSSHGALLTLLASWRKEPIHIRQVLYISGQKLILRTKDRKDGMARLVLRSLLPTPGPFHFRTSTIHSMRFAPLCDHHFLRWYLNLPCTWEILHTKYLSRLTKIWKTEVGLFLKAKLLTELYEVIFYRLWSTLSRAVHLSIPKIGARIFHLHLDFKRVKLSSARTLLERIRLF